MNYLMDIKHEKWIVVEWRKRGEKGREESRKGNRTKGGIEGRGKKR